MLAQAQLHQQCLYFAIPAAAMDPRDPVRREGREAAEPMTILRIVEDSYGAEKRRPSIFLLADHAAERAEIKFHQLPPLTQNSTSNHGFCFNTRPSQIKSTFVSTCFTSCKRSLHMSGARQTQLIDIRAEKGLAERDEFAKVGFDGVDEDEREVFDPDSRVRVQ
jgi:hypothetical protein